MERKIHPSATSKPKREFTSSSLTKPMTSQSKCKAHPASSGTKTATPPSIHSTSDQEASFGMNFESTAQLQPAFATALHVAKQQTQSSRLLSLPAEILDMTLDYIFSTLDLSLSTYTHSLTVVQATPKFRKTVPFYFMSVADSDTWPSRNMEPCLRPWRVKVGVLSNTSRLKIYELSQRLLIYGCRLPCTSCAKCIWLSETT
jgi:hypothetical protein